MRTAINYFFTNSKMQMLCILLTLICGCVHSPNPEEECINIKDIIQKHKGYTFDLNYVSAFRGQCFNPNNSNEIMYYGYSGKYSIEDTITIYKYNLKTHIRSKIVNVKGNPSFPKWAANDWILFELLDNQFHKVKSNGDSLTKLTSEYPHFHPKWSYYADKIVGFLRVNYGYLSVFDKNGNLTDSILYNPLTPHIAWNVDDIIALGDGKEVTFLQYPELVRLKTIILLDKGDSDPNITGLEWIPNTTKFVWTCKLGIFITDYITEQTQQIKEGCEINTYCWPSVSGDGTKLLVSRIEYRVNKATRTVETFCNIYIMNINGLGEEEMIFPN